MGLTPVIWTRISPSATFDTGGKSTSYPLATPLTDFQQISTSTAA